MRLQLNFNNLKGILQGTLTYIFLSFAVGLKGIGLYPRPYRAIYDKDDKEAPKLNLS